MDKFATLEPVKLHASKSRRRQTTITQPLVGRLPSDLHLLVLAYLPLPDFPAYSRCSHSTAALAQDEQIWKMRWNFLGVEQHDLGMILEELEQRNKEKTAASRASAPPVVHVDDEFGDFSGGEVFNPPADEMGDFVGAFQNVIVSQAIPLKVTFRNKFMRASNLLKPLTRYLASPSHVILSELASTVSSSLRLQAKLLHLLSAYLSPQIQPIRRWDTLYSSLRSAMDRFDANLLAAFDVADEKNDEVGMKAAAESSWEVWDGIGDWEMGKVWAEKREIFYEQGKWEPLDNFPKEGGLAFDAMDEFMSAVLDALNEHGSRAVRVFPPPSQVLLSFAERLATEVVGEYITTLLVHARGLSADIYLKSAAASFGESWKMVDIIIQAAAQNSESKITRTDAEDIVYRMFETNMDEYLDEEVESVKAAFDAICGEWNRQTVSSTVSAKTDATTRFLASHNPAQVKRNVLASFTSVLLLPVTIVPRTVNAVGGAIMTGGSAAVQGISMLNPQRWGGSGQVGPITGYSRKLEKQDAAVFELADEEDDIGSEGNRYSTGVRVGTNGHTTPLEKTEVKNTPTPASNQQLDLLLSLDTALELIHADREALKRVETFAGYPGHFGHRVHDTIEEIFILVLQAMGEQHMSKGFGEAIERMKSYKPAEHEETTSVAPLLQFFELVHVGDTIQSMVQVYFEKELVHHIDKTDFLNAVVREKKRFENTLDDCVAAGLNAGTDVLMQQVEHIILTRTKPREYYPPEDGPLDLGPTKGCTESIKCLEMHCKLLKGSTNKEVLEVFYQEIGIRLIAILQKHIKRQIISLNGGFQLIADLNTYHAFVSSLKVPSIAADFSHLKMLGHVFVVEDAKDLAQIVRDVTRYGGAYRPEDIYEFVQRRADWKKIEKTVDKTMYNLSFKEDCIIC